MLRVRPLLVVTSCVALIAAATPVLAQDQGVGSIGVRAGGTIDPDQFHFGLQLNAGMVSPRVRFQPSVEVGFGSDRTTLVGNFDFLYLAYGNRTVQTLFGAGLGVGGMWFSTGSGPEHAGTDRPAEGLIGLNLIAGLEWGTRPVADVPESKGSQVRWLVEIRAGIGDLPAFKATIGINF